MKTHLSPKELATAAAVSESSVKRWIEDGRLSAARTAGGHRRIPLAEAVDFIRRANLPVAQPGALGLTPSDAEPAGVATALAPEQLLTDALLAGHVDRAQSALMSMYLQGQSVAALCDGPVMHAMAHIGSLWQHDENGIFIEHRATSICFRLMHELHALLPPAPADAPLALGAAPSGDPYRLGSLAVALGLASIKWRTMDLGADLPFDALRRAALQHDAKLVWLSVSHVESQAAFGRQLADLSCDLGEAGITLVAGGRALTQPPTNALGTLHIIRTITELAAFAQGLRQAG